MINLETNETICTSCPLFGDEPDVPGREDGYVVKIADDDLTPPYVINPGTRIRVQVSTEFLSRVQAQQPSLASHYPPPPPPLSLFLTSAELQAP